MIWIGTVACAFVRLVLNGLDLMVYLDDEDAIVGIGNDKKRVDQVIIESGLQPDE